MACVLVELLKSSSTLLIVICGVVEDNFAILAIISCDQTPYIVKIEDRIGWVES